MLTQDMIDEMLKQMKFLYPEEEPVTIAKSMDEPETLNVKTDIGYKYKIVWNNGNIITSCINPNE